MYIRLAGWRTDLYIQNGTSARPYMVSRCYEVFALHYLRPVKVLTDCE